MMHQGPKSTKPLTQQELSKKEKLGKEIDEMLQKFIKLRHASSPQDVGIKDAFQFTTIMAQMCPDLYTIYNYRKELIEKKYEGKEPQEYYQFIEKELEFLNGLLKKTPKSYCIWHHRKYMILEACKIEEQLNIAFEQSIINKELFLCSKMLEKDERNFHAWNYRNWIVNVDSKVKFDLIKKEIDYTKNKIAVNFTNFSALHFRLLIAFFTLQQKDEQNEIFNFQMPLKIINEDFEMLKTGLYMQPNEQGIWQYHNWLLELLQPIKIYALKIFQPVQANKASLLLCFSEKIANFLKENIEIRGMKEEKEIDLTIEIQQLNKNKKYTKFYFIQLSSQENFLDQSIEINLRIRNSYQQSNFTNLHNKKLFTESAFQLNLSKNRVQLEQQNQNQIELQKLIAEIMDRELKIVNEILQLEPDNKFVRMEQSWILQKQLKSCLFEENSNKENQILELFMDIIKNYEKLVSKYPKQEEMFNYFLCFYSGICNIWQCLTCPSDSDANDQRIQYLKDNWKEIEDKLTDLDDYKILILAKIDEENQVQIQDLLFSEKQKMKNNQNN